MRWCLDFVAFEIDLLAVDAASSLAAGFVQRLEGVACLTLEEEAGGVCSQLAEDALTADIRRALFVGLAQIFLHALVLSALVGPHVAFQHRDRSDSGIADGVFAAQRASGQRAVRERRLQGVQQVHDDADEL